MSDSTPKLSIRECVCTNCGDSRLTPIGTPCLCGGKMKAIAQGENVRKAFGLEDTDLRKA